jgi:hypothetical protein
VVILTAGSSPTISEACASIRSKIINFLKAQSDKTKRKEKKNKKKTKKQKEPLRKLLFLQNSFFEELFQVAQSIKIFHLSLPRNLPLIDPANYSFFYFLSILTMLALPSVAAWSSGTQSGGDDAKSRAVLPWR